MHDGKSTASRPRSLRIGSIIVLAGAALHLAAAHALPTGSARMADATPAPQRVQAAPSRWNTDARDPVTGKLQKSPVLGPVADDGIMGGTIPSAVPGWQPHRKDAEDAYVYVPGTGWLQGDTRQERRD